MVGYKYDLDNKAIPDWGLLEFCTFWQNYSEITKKKALNRFLKCRGTLHMQLNYLLHLKERIEKKKQFFS